MNFPLLQISAKPISLLQLLLSVFLLLRGHNEPGGGFIGGLMAVSAFVLLALAFDVPLAKKWLKFSPHAWTGCGLAIALSSGALAWVFQKPFMTGLWGQSLWLPFVSYIKLGTPLLFDIGVYFLVIGIGTLIIFTLMDMES